MATDDPTHDAIVLLRTLSVEAIQARLDTLTSEADALRVLLRSARARERRREITRPKPPRHQQQEERHDA